MADGGSDGDASGSEGRAESDGDSREQRLPWPPPTELWSRDAGVYYCNEAYYRALYEVRAKRIPPASAAPAAARSPKTTRGPRHRQTPLLPLMFVHLPAAETTSVDASAAVIRHIATLVVG